MIRIIFILCFVLSANFFVYGQKNYRSFLPADYDTLDGGIARGDLNKDGMEDLALALYHKQEKEPSENTDVDNIPARKLLILFGAGEGYVGAIATSKALLCKDCGGIYGDPFAGLEISNHVLTIYHYGGSAWRWSYTHKFQNRSGNFVLIGRTKESFHSGGECEKLNHPTSYEMKDENLITGSYREIKVSEDCKLLKDKKGKQKVQPLISLSKFTIED
jgi:hypothetical protein